MKTGALTDERFIIRQATGGRTSDFAGDVRRGLTATPKVLLPQYFYDALGSELFTAICELPEYYVTRAETEILRLHAAEIARAFGPVSRLIELGSGNGQKTQLLIEAILSRQPKLLFQPVDIDATVLKESARLLLSEFPSLAIDALCTDFREVGKLGASSGRTVVLFLGSSIGNLDHTAATELLRDVRRILNSSDAFLVGFDLEKDKPIVEAAYDDSLGVTAAFNLNLLGRINRELGGHFDLSQFSHRAFFNDTERRIEMHLVSKIEQTVAIDRLGIEVAFNAGESIHTENSYKYDMRRIESLAAAADFRIEHRWTDARGWFADVLLRA